MNMTKPTWKNGLRFIVLIVPLLLFIACTLNGEQIKQRGTSAEKEGIRNPILALSISEGHDQVEVIIEAERPIVYTTFRQMNPERLIIEISHGVWRKLEGPIEVNNGLIQKIVNRQLGSASNPLARMEVLIDNMSSYDIRPQSHRLILLLLRDKGEGKIEAKSEEPEPLSTLEVKEVTPKEPKESANIKKEVTVLTARRIVDFFITRENGNARIVLIGDGEFRNYSSFRVTHPDRVVIDIWDVRRIFKRSSFPGDGIYFSNVRFGDHSDKVRIVVDVMEKEGVFCRLNTDANKLVFAIGDRNRGGENAILFADLPTFVPKRIKTPEKVGEAAKKKAAGIEEEGEKRKLALGPVARSDGQERLPEGHSETLSTRPELSSIAASSPVGGKGLDRPALTTLLGKDLLLQAPSVQFQPTPADQPIAPFPKIHTGVELGRDYKGRRVNLDFQNIDIHNVFRLLAEISNLNIIVDDKVKGRITMRLVDVPWDQALDLILATKDLGMIVDGNIRRIAPLKDLRRKEQEIRKVIEERQKAMIKAEEERQKAAIEAREREKALEPLVTETIFVNYTKVKDVEKQFKTHLTKRGTMTIDERTNSLTITDVEKTIQTIKALLKVIDTATPQVMIEARIVEADKSFGRSLGIQWGAAGLWNNPNTNRYVYAADSGPQDYQTFVPESTQAERWDENLPVGQYAVNFPAGPALAGATPAAFGFKFGRIIGDLISLDLRLSLSEAEGLTRVISRPKITTLDNIQATIKSGESIPFETVSEQGTQTTLVDAVLELTVTPHVTPDGKVKMDIMATKNSIGTFRTATGSPSITKREATTQVLVGNGETTVIGGIFTQSKAVNMAGVPWFSKIPILGWLFKGKRWEDKKEELLIFITPFIIKEEPEREAMS